MLFRFTTSLRNSATAAALAWALTAAGAQGSGGFVISTPGNFLRWTWGSLKAKRGIQAHKFVAAVEFHRNQRAVNGYLIVRLSELDGCRVCQRNRFGSDAFEFAPRVAHF